MEILYNLIEKTIVSSGSVRCYVGFLVFRYRKLQQLKSRFPFFKPSDRRTVMLMTVSVFLYKKKSRPRKANHSLPLFSWARNFTLIAWFWLVL